MGIPDEANKKRTNGSDFPSRSSPIADGWPFVEWHSDPNRKEAFQKDNKIRILSNRKFSFRYTFLPKAAASYSWYTLNQSLCLYDLIDLTISRLSMLRLVSNFGDFSRCA